MKQKNVFVFLQSDYILKQIENLLYIKSAGRQFTGSLVGGSKAVTRQADRRQAKCERQIGGRQTYKSKRQVDRRQSERQKTEMADRQAAGRQPTEQPENEAIDYLVAL